MEVVVTAVRDGFPKFTEKYFKCHEVLVLLICVISLLLGLPNVLQVSAYAINNLIRAFQVPYTIDE